MVVPQRVLYDLPQAQSNLPLLCEDGRLTLPVECVAVGLHDVCSGPVVHFLVGGLAFGGTMTTVQI